MVLIFSYPDLFSWLKEISKSVKVFKFKNNLTVKSRIDQFFFDKHCISCKEDISPKEILCAACLKSNEMRFLIGCTHRMTENAYYDCVNICKETCGVLTEDAANKCVSTDCQNYYNRNKTKQRMEWICDRFSNLF